MMLAADNPELMAAMVMEPALAARQEGIRKIRRPVRVGFRF